MEIRQNKKVLLRERKRHTTRRVVSTPSVVLPGYPPQGGYPDLGTPPPRGGTRTSVPPWGGTRTSVPPPGGTPTSVPPPPPPRGGGGTWTSVPPPGGTQTSVPPRGGTGGVPRPRYPPRGGTGPGYPPGGGYPDPPSPPRCGQTNKVKLLPSRRTTYAGGNNFRRSQQALSTCYILQADDGEFHSCEFNWKRI